MSEATPEMTFEQAVQRLETVVNELESRELGLDESLRRYEEGIALYRRCMAVLDAAQRRIEVLTDASGPQPAAGLPGALGCEAGGSAPETAAD